MASKLVTLEKQPFEKRWWSHVFTGKMAAGETITGLVSIVIEDKAGGSPTLVFTNATIINDGQAIEARYEAGDDGHSYLVTCKVTTTRTVAGQSLEWEGIVKVKERK